jgi:hypothetical protein
LGVPGIALAAVFAFHAPVLAADPGDDDVTFTKDVAPILQENCQVCHQEGSIGPMELMTYDQVRPWGAVIKDRVVTREMPPYQYDTDVGIQELKYDPRLSEEDIATIVAWVDGGMAMGDPADMPAPVEFPDPAQFRLAERFGRQPDVIVRSTPYSVPGIGQDRWWQPVVPTGITEDRCIMAIETKPAVDARMVTHHANSYFRVNGQQSAMLSEFAIGKIGEIIPEDACRTAPANSEVSWDIHYWPNGVDVPAATVEIGIWFYPAEREATTYRQDLTLYYLQGGVGGRGYDIAPHGTLMTQGFRSFNHPVRIDSFQPHGHTRMVAMSLQILRKSGRLEMVSMVSNWSALWHHSHIYQDHVAPLLDVGDQLVLTGWYDNTANNRYNPDPDQWVSIGDRTADEMSHAWLAVTHLDQEGYEKLLAERQARTTPTTD